MQWNGGGAADLCVPGSPLATLTGGPLCAPAEPFVLALQLKSQAVKRGNDIMKLLCERRKGSESVRAACTPLIKQIGNSVNLHVIRRLVCSNIITTLTVISCF